MKFFGAAWSSVLLTAFSIIGSQLTGCGSDFTCSDDRTCAPPNNPDSAGGSSGTGGSAGSSGSAGSGGSAGSSDSGGSTGDAGTGDAATDGDAGANPDSSNCTPGTEGCACTAGRDCNTGLICRGTTCVQTVCGDSRVEGSEFCDDGRNLGTAAGDCAPDCTTIVMQKKIVLSAQDVRINLGKDGPGSIIKNADSFCTTGYKALFSDGLNRIASVTPNVGDGQNDWVLHPWTRYVNGAGALIWLTNATTLLGVVNRMSRPLTNPITTGSVRPLVITGLSRAWTALPPESTCSKWTSSTTGDMEMAYPWTTDLYFLQADAAYPCSSLSQTLHPSIYCVEQ